MFDNNTASEYIRLMKVQLVTDQESLKEAKTIAYGIYEGEIPVEANELSKIYLKENPKFGKPYEIQLLYTEKQSYLLVGLGKKDKFDFSACQNFAGTVVKSLFFKTKEAIIIPPESDNLIFEEEIYAMAIGAELASHDPGQIYKSESEPAQLISLQIFLNKVRGEEKNAF